jgi:hypothetical protein
MLTNNKHKWKLSRNFLFIFICLFVIGIFYRNFMCKQVWVDAFAADLNLSHPVDTHRSLFRYVSCCYFLKFILIFVYAIIYYCLIYLLSKVWVDAFAADLNLSHPVDPHCSLFWYISCCYFLKFILIFVYAIIA